METLPPQRALPVHLASPPMYASYWLPPQHAANCIPAIPPPPRPVASPPRPAPTESISSSQYSWLAENPFARKRRMPKRPSPNLKKQLGFACSECGMSETIERRAGPAGPATLCNACGLRWRKYLNKVRQEQMEKTREQMKIARILD